LNFKHGAYVYHDVKRITACLSAAALLLALPVIGHADQFTQVQNNPNTYWVPSGQGQGQAQNDPKDVVQAPPAPNNGAPPPPSYYYAPRPGPYVYYPPGYVAGPAPYYYGPPPRYYAPPPAAYYGPPPVAVGYYGGHYGSRVVVGIPGLFFGFHIH